MENRKTVQANKCSVDNCEFPHCGRKGMCDRHYRKFVKYGDPTAGRFIYGGLRLSDKAGVQKYIRSRSTVTENGCWMWTGAKNTCGYGTCRIEKMSVLSHRLSLYAFSDFDMSSGVLACHHCDNPSCVNPLHLFAGSNQDNADDKMAKGRGRWVRGENVNTSRWSAGDVLEVRRMFASGKSRSEIAMAMGMDRGTVGDMVTYRSWKHVTRPVPHFKEIKKTA